MPEKAKALLQDNYSIACYNLVVDMIIKDVNIMRKPFFSGLILIIFTIFFCCGYTLTTFSHTNTLQVPEENAETPLPVDNTFTITAVGDIMMHNTQIKAGFDPQQGTYDFSSFFTNVAPIFQASDLVIGNLETTLAGEAAKYSGYPRFNAPEILADNLKAAGFDILTTANNHSLDKNYGGLVATLDHLDQVSLLHTGTSRTQEEQEKILLTEVKGVKLAVLAYTYGTNGIRPEKGKEFAVNYIDDKKMISDIAKAKEQGAQLVIVALHCGQEYQPYPNSVQKQLSQALLEAGADIILGHHPHVLQPTDIITTPAGESSRDKFVIYSLGNFISAQRGLERRCSIILNLHMDIDEKGQPYFKEATYIPIYTRSFRDKGLIKYEVLPLEPVLTSIKNGTNPPYTKQEIDIFEQSFNHVTTHLHSDLPCINIHSLPLPLEGLELLETLKVSSDDTNM